MATNGSPAATKADLAHLSKLLEDMKDSLESAADRTEAAVRRHSAMILAGTVSIGTITKTLTRLEDGMRTRDKQLRELRDRVRILERKAGK
jgi:hypothetical protein